MLKDLLLDILDILFPLLLYQFMILTKPSLTLFQKQMLLGLLCGLAIVLSILLPDVITNDLEGDLRSIPLIIALLYGGFRGGTIAFACLIVCRYFIQLDGFLMTAMASILVFTISCFFIPHFHKRSPASRWIIGVCLSTGAYLLSWGTTFFSSQLIESTSFVTLMQIGWVQLATTCVSVLLMEETIKTQSLQEQIIRNEKLNVTGQLAGSVAHEIRSPLTSMKGFLQLTLRSTDGKNREYLEITMSELNRVESIIDDFINLAQPQMEVMEKLSISEMLNQVKEYVHPLALTNRVKLTMDIEPHLWIQANSCKITEALVAIIHNSIEASSHMKGWVSIKAYRQWNRVCIEISDNGIGMTPEELGRLGTPYYSTKTNGTGLSLMAAYRIIQAISGKLEYRSVKGKGTTALMILPISK